MACSAGADLPVRRCFTLLRGIGTPAARLDRRPLCEGCFFARNGPGNFSLGSKGGCSRVLLTRYRACTAGFAVHR